jgi:hypothetical protein
MKNWPLVSSKYYQMVVSGRQWSSERYQRSPEERQWSSKVHQWSSQVVSQKPQILM